MKKAISRQNRGGRRQRPEHPKRYLAAALLTAMAVHLALLSGSCFVTFLQPAFLIRECEKSGVAAERGLDENEMKSVIHLIYRYIYGREARLEATVRINGVPTDFFTGRDQVHMKDVRHLMQGLIILFCVTTAGSVFGICVLHRKGAERLLLREWLICLAVLIVLLAAVGIYAAADTWDFEYKFHALFFPNNNCWILNPAEDHMIWLFPDAMFMDAILLCGGVFAALEAAFGGLLAARRKTAGKA